MATGKNAGWRVDPTPARARLNPAEMYSKQFPVLLFKKILNFDKATVNASDKRGAVRYTVGQPFPFKSIVTLIGHDGEGKPIVGDTRGQDWSGRLVNLSATGASMQMHSAAIAIRGEPCVFKLSLDTYLLEIPGTVAHFRCYPQYVLCGVAFNFADLEVKKAYLQVLEPVSIGATMSPTTAKVKQDVEGLLRETFQNDENCVLNVWREARPGGTIQSFDFRMNQYGVRWGTGMTELETYAANEAKRKGTAPPFARRLTEAQQEEVRWLFCLAVPNLPKSIPADVRKFLSALVSA